MERGTRSRDAWEEQAEQGRDGGWVGLAMIADRRRRSRRSTGSREARVGQASMDGYWVTGGAPDGHEGVLGGRRGGHQSVLELHR